MRQSNRFVPIFNDKHLSYSWENAKWMYDTAREHGIPLGAGSSISVCPVSWREPALELPLGTHLDGALAVGHGPLESYGFHTLEVLQCMVERRAGGETGVAAVQALSGDAMWAAAERGEWDRALLDAALATLEPPLDGDVHQVARRPVVYLVDYRDGLRAAAAMLDGVAQQWLFAGRIGAPSAAVPSASDPGANVPSASVPEDSGAPQVVATRFRSQGGEPFGHFAWLCEDIQTLICEQREPHPVERTLLTSGVLDRLMESLWRGGARLETPELAISYRVQP
jgi:hypothetical protein